MKENVSMFVSWQKRTGHQVFYSIIVTFKQRVCFFIRTKCSRKLKCLVAGLEIEREGERGMLNEKPLESKGLLGNTVYKQLSVWALEKSFTYSSALCQNSIFSSVKKWNLNKNGRWCFRLVTFTCLLRENKEICKYVHILFVNYFRYVKLYEYNKQSQHIKNRLFTWYFWNMRGKNYEEYQM